ncbi:hypothetical protein AAFF_G00305540 [Aldrovandia affinis]|uniref:Coiled-coil domain containing 18 n=1 Tax=Aldrovandia affinis TaxID=143900 RepID=A0AAD7SQC1_9TELE|nr:hypothetical protein AAFF_G00305540 [Aldrovandia affinis]
MFHRNKEDLVKDVVNLRNQLRLTEVNLQSLGEQLSGSNSENSDHSPQRFQPGGLTLEDLQRPDVAQPPPISPILPETCHTMSSGNVHHIDYRPPSVTVIECENAHLRKAIDGVREENSCLVLENQKLITELEEVQIELAGSQTKIQVLGSTVGSKSSSLYVMKEQIQGLEAEVEAHAIALRASEQKLEEKQQSVVMSSRMVTKLKQELKAVQAELEHRTSQGKRAEQQRNEALRNAEKLTMAFKEYKGNVSEKMNEVLDNEMNLKQSLIECDRQREEVESRCSKLERERADMSQLIWQLKEDSGKVSRLERELAESKDAAQEAELRRRENGELRSFASSQEQRLAHCLQEAEQSRAELASLEAILNTLHLREGGGALCVKPCVLPQVSFAGHSDFRNVKPGERYAQLLPVLQALEQERSRQAGLVSGLQTQLSQAQEEASTLQSSMAQRASHFQHIHNELLEKASQASGLERELRKKSARLVALEKQLQEKAAAYSAAAVKNCELEQILLDKSSSLQSVEALLSRKQKDFQQALDKSKKAHAGQCKQLQDQNEQLQRSVDQKKAQVTKEKELKGLQSEESVRSLKAQAAESAAKAKSLEAALMSCKDDLGVYLLKMEETKTLFEKQLELKSNQAKSLEAALMSCKDDLGVYLLKMEETKTLFEKQLELKSNQVESLEAELRNSALASKTSGKHMVQLQYSLQQQEAMLQESNARIFELEESQALLERQVSQLEQELEVERTGGAQELRMREQREQEASQEAQMKERQVVKLTSSLTQLTAEMSQCRGELTEMELELLRLRRDSSTKASQLNQVEQTLQETQGMLEKKSELVMDLEEKLHRSEMDRRNSLQRAQLLEGQLQTVRGELAGTLDHLQELRDVLQRTQLTAEEREAAMEKLAEELRESKSELEERNHEVLDMDTALKERQEELQKRALQLNQLDVAIREHKLEMERKILHLQRALERSEQEVQERHKQVEFLSERLEMARTQLNEKENLEMDALDQGQQLRLCREQLQRTAQEQQELRSHCEGLARELDSSVQLVHEREAQARQAAQERAATEAQAVQKEAGLQATVASLHKELERVKEEHHVEVSSLQQSRAQLLKVSEHSRSSQEQRAGQLAEQVQRLRAQLEEAQDSVARLQGELYKCKQQLQSASDALHIKEAEVSRLQTKISGRDRAPELQNASLQRESVLKALVPHPGHKEAPLAADFPDWADDDDDSLDLPQSVKDCLQVALRPADRSWQGLSRLEATSSELSFNPLTYAANEDTVLESPSHSYQEDTFANMLRFLSSQTAGAEDTAPSWMSSTSAGLESFRQRQKDPVGDDNNSPADT